MSVGISIFWHLAWGVKMLQVNNFKHSKWIKDDLARLFERDTR